VEGTLQVVYKARGTVYSRFYGGLNGMVAVGGPKGANTHI
jgi:hypothetical protein